MPQAAAHIIIPLLIMSLVRDYYIKKKDKKYFPLHYVLIAGIAGVIPDLDVAAFWILHFFDFKFSEVHRTFAHSLFVPFIFLLIAIVIPKGKFKYLREHKINLKIVFYMIAFGSFSHLVVDGIFQNAIMPFYPLSNWFIGLNLFGYLPRALEIIAAPSLDAGIIIFYLIYLEWRHKVSDFI